jgi:beta-xylosidase
MKAVTRAFIAAQLILTLFPLVVLPQKSTNTPYSNPILWADAPDLSVTRHGDDYYMISTTMHLMPGAPIMKSKDLVHWELINYVFDKLTDGPKYDLLKGTVYGRGQWASSIRFHNGKYYVLFSPNDEPHKSYMYTTDDPAGKWTLLSRMQHFHDNSLFFDDNGKVYVYYGSGQIRELKTDLSGVKENGLNLKIFEKDSTETGLLEGSQAIKYNGKYYLLMISWPKGGKRRQVCYRADRIEGPYEKKVILEAQFAGFPYVGQGCIIDDKLGNWYGLIFQDRGAVGRVPLLMPVRWEEGWPMLGTSKGQVPESGIIPLKPFDSRRKVVESDDFSKQNFKINWQWNHNPIDSAWSLKERPGFLRLKTSRLVKNLFLAPNTISQRMEGPKSSGTVSIDVSNMKNGDVAGLAAFNGHTGMISITMEDGSKSISFVSNVVELSKNTKEVLNVDIVESKKIPLKKNIIFLRLDADFNEGKDLATFYFSLDNKNWTQIGDPYKMRFDYSRLFMGTRFAIFNYATQNVGGFVDIDFFHFSNTDK